MIDWNVIRKFEGFTLEGYVPDPASSRSGVTIATGVDIGNMSRTYFLTLPDALQNRLLPYLGLIRTAALAKLQQMPLTITQAEADILDTQTQQSATAGIAGLYDRYSKTPFAALTDAQQTVLCSLFYQYGNLPVRCPHFWSLAIAQNWPGVIEELRHFGDAYTTRRNTEADLLSQSS